MKSTFPFLRNKIARAAIVIIVVGGGMYLFSGRGSAPRELITVTRGSIIEEVVVTGNLKSKESVSLGFERSGIVAHVFKDVGDSVWKGERIADLVANDLYAQLKEAQSNYDAEFATLSSGDAYTKAFAVVSDAFVKSDDAVTRQTEALFIDDDGDIGLNPQLAFSTTNENAKYDAESGRFASDTILEAWRRELYGPSSEQATADIILERAASRLLTIQGFLDRTVEALNDASSISQTVIDEYRNSLMTARANMSTAMTAVAGKIEDIEVQKSRVKSADAKVEGVYAEIAKTVIQAPFTGVITKQEADVGELVSANAEVVSLVSAKQLEIEVNIPESDIARVAVGKKARVTVDAYRDSVELDATVARIDPAATVIEGVPTYKTTLTFQEIDAVLRPGMTVDVTIVVDAKENVIVVPQRVVRGAGDKKNVFVATPEGVEERAVVTGLRGADGMVEIVSGLAEGEKITTSFNQSK